MTFKKRYVEQGQDDETKVLTITPVCHSCAADIHSQMLLQYIDILYGDGGDNDNGNKVGRNRNDKEEEKK